MKIRQTIAFLLFALFAVSNIAMAVEIKKEKSQEELEKEKQERRAKALAFAESGTTQKIQAVNTASSATKVTATVARTDNAVKASKQYRAY